MGKTIAGIVRQKVTLIIRQYYFEALRFYDEVIYIDPHRVTYRLDRASRSIQIDYEGSSLNDLCMLYNFGYAESTLLLVKALAICGCPSSDPYDISNRGGLGKAPDLLEFINSGVGTSGHILTSLDTATTYINDLSEEYYPLLLKPIAGYKGIGIKKLDNCEEAVGACKAHFRQREDVLLLEKFMDYRHKYRVYVVDNIAVEAYERLKEEGSVAGNLHQGGSVVAVEDTVKQRLFDHVYTHLSDRFKLGIYGVDLAITDSGDMHILEVNRAPGSEGLDRLGRLNFPRYAHEVIYKRSRKSEIGIPAGRAEYVITFLGDTNPGHSYAERAEAQGSVSAPTRLGCQHSFQNFRDLLATSNYTFANLEVCVTKQRESPLAGKKAYIDHADVEDTINVLKSSEISAVSLANNHTMDYGEAGLIDTIDAMKAGGIAFFGAGRMVSEAESVLHHHCPIGNATLHVIVATGFQYMKNHDEWGYYADSEHAGVNSWRQSRAMEQVSALRRQHENAYIIAFPHWGTSYAKLSETQQRLGKSLIDSGADLVIGHGSHMLQEITRYKGRWLIYGIGNFVYNSPGRFGKSDVLPYGLIGRLVLENTIGKIECSLQLYPIQSNNKKTQYKPNFVSEREFYRVLRFYMPLTKTKAQIQSLVRSGKDSFGYYFSLDLGRFSR